MTIAPRRRVRLGLATCKRCGEAFPKRSQNHGTCDPCVEEIDNEMRLPTSFEEVPAHLKPEHDWLCDNPMDPEWQARHAAYTKAAAAARRSA